MNNLFSLILQHVQEILYFVNTDGDPTRGSVEFCFHSDGLRLTGYYARFTVKAFLIILQFLKVFTTYDK